MGAADIVPGVSGGTIAFITGIYFRLLEAINAVPQAFFQHLIRGQVRQFWAACDGTFLLCLLAGFRRVLFRSLGSIATLASVISHALAAYPILIWSFFFGLIVASVWHVGRQVRRYEPMLLLPFSVGTVFAWWVTTLSGSPLSPSMPVFFGAGALAICAMILPGISGSFILVILGMYVPVLDAIRSLDLGILGIFAVGCLVGLLSVARLITWAFHRYHDLVLALLTGFMVGALNEASVSPISYAELTGDESQLLLAMTCALAGLSLVLLVEWVGRKKQPGAAR